MGFFRNLFQLILFIALVVLIPLTLTAHWAREQIYDEDTFIASVDDLYADSDVQDAIASVVSREVVDQSSGMEWPEFVEAITDDIGLRDELDAMDIEIGPFVHDRVLDVLETDTFQVVWVEAMQRVHPLIEQILRGEDSTLIKTSNGVVRIDLVPVIDAVNAGLQDQGIDLTDQFSIDPDRLTIVLFQGEQLVQAQRAVELLDRFYVLALFGLVIIPLLLILVTVHKVRAIIAIGVAVLLGMLIEAGALFVGERYLSDASGTVAQDRAAAAIFAELVSVLWRWALYGFAAGAVVLLVGLIIGQLGSNRSRSVYPR